MKGQDYLKLEMELENEIEINRHLSDLFKKKVGLKMAQSQSSKGEHQRSSATTTKPLDNTRNYTKIAKLDKKRHLEYLHSRAAAIDPREVYGSMERSLWSGCKNRKSELPIQLINSFFLEMYKEVALAREKRDSLLKELGLSKIEVNCLDGPGLLEKCICDDHNPEEPIFGYLFDKDPDPSRWTKYSKGRTKKETSFEVDNKFPSSYFFEKSATLASEVEVLSMEDLWSDWSSSWGSGWAEEQKAVFDPIWHLVEVYDESTDGEDGVSLRKSRASILDSSSDENALKRVGGWFRKVGDMCSIGKRVQPSEFPELGPLDELSDIGAWDEENNIGLGLKLNSPEKKYGSGVPKSYVFRKSSIPETFLDSDSSYLEGSQSFDQIELERLKAFVPTRMRQMELNLWQAVARIKQADQRELESKKEDELIKLHPELYLTLLYFRERIPLGQMVED